MGAYAGIDLGGTHLRATVVDTESRKLLCARRMPTLAREGHEAVIRRMANLVQEAIQESGIESGQVGGIGIGVPGAVDMDQGRVQYLTNLAGHWIDVPLKQQIEEQVGLPTHLINDARAMTFGEWVFGAGQCVDSMVCYGIGTGIGGGFIINGKLHLGMGGLSGELGHQIVEPEGFPCGCGGRGCLETLASGPAITSMATKAIAHGMVTKIGELVDYDQNRVTPEIVHKAALLGDELAIEIYERAGFYIGLSITNILTAIGVQRAVIGGGVAQAGETLLEPIRRTVRERLRFIPFERVEIVPAELGPDAGLIGAALWAKECASA